MAKPRTSTISKPRPKVGEEGSGHLFVVQHGDGQIRAACSCGESMRDLKDAPWRFRYEDVRADYDKLHAERVRAAEAGS